MTRPAAQKIVADRLGAMAAEITELSASLRPFPCQLERQKQLARLRRKIELCRTVIESKRARL